MMNSLVILFALVLESPSNWTSQQIQTMTERTNRILSQCQIQIQMQDPIFYFGKMSMDYDAIGLANQFYQQQKKPVIFLITARQYNGSAGWTPGNHYVFLSSYTQQVEYKQKRHPDYETLAHELGHMLGNLQHLSTGEYNLMAGYIANQSTVLTKEQCLAMRARLAR